MSIFSITANRASAILYSYVKSRNIGVWLIPVNVCPDVPLTLCAAKVSFEFVDINPETLCMDENTCLRTLYSDRNKYAGIIFVRTYGYLYDNNQFYEACRTIVPNIRIIDDRCLCLPSFEPLTYGSDMVLYSTGHCKQIDLGGGGYAFSKENFKLIANESYSGINEELIYKKAFQEDILLKDIPLGWLKVTKYKEIYAYKNVVEALTPQRIEQRDRINSVYKDNLRRDIQFNDVFQSWRFNIKVNAIQKDAIIHRLFKEGLFASNHYHCANRLFDRLVYPNATTLFKTTINLFNDNNYTEGMAKRTCEIINSILADWYC